MIDDGVFGPKAIMLPSSLSSLVREEESEEEIVGDNIKI